MNTDDKLQVDDEEMVEEADGDVNEQLKTEQ